MTSTVARLLALEALEQASWTTRIPAWHPRAETGGEGAGGEGGEGAAGESTGTEGTGTGGAGEDDDNAPAGLTRAEARALEKARDDAQKAAAAAARRERERARQAAHQAGNYEELYNEEKGRTEKVTGLVRTNAIASGVSAAAERLGFNTPSLAARLIDTKDLNVEVDLDAEVFPELDSAAQVIVERRLTEVARREPGLLRQGPGRMLPGAGQGGGQGEGNGNASMNTAIRRAAGRA